MDNEAFRALVNAGSKGTGTGSSSGNSKNKNNKKTTKEIAREAVEEEFRLIKKNKEKNKRKHKQKYDDDDEDDDGYFSKPQKKKKASLSDDDNQHDIDDDDDDGDPNDDIGNNKGKRIQYRDRAKERRKGIANRDYESTDTSKNKNLTAEMTKYLGGDEQHTHLVRGLDYALADKVRREQKAQRKTIDSLEDQKQNSNNNLKEREDTRNNYNISSGDGDGESDKTLSKEEKNQKLKSLAYQQILNSMSNGGHRNSDLCQPIISYYFHKYTNNNKDKKSTNKISLAGQSIQRSSLKFLASNNNIHNKKLAWEIPRENISFSSTTTSSASSQASSVFFRGHTFLDQDLIERIIQAQDKIRGKSQKAGSNSFSNSKHGVYRSEQDEARKSDPTNANINESDDDSDIFEDLDDYVPS